MYDFLIVLPPGKRLLLTPGMGMGGGTIWDHLESFRIILGPLITKSYVFQANINFLAMAPTNFFSSIRMTAYQPLIRTRNNILQHFEIPHIKLQKFNTSKLHFSTFHFQTVEYVHLFYILGVLPG